MATGIVAGAIGLGLAVAASGAGGARPAAALQAAWADTVPARQVAGATWDALPLPVEKPLRLEAPASGAFFLVLGLDRANLFALGEGNALYRLRLVPQLAVKRFLFDRYLLIVLWRGVERPKKWIVVGCVSNQEFEEASSGIQLAPGQAIDQMVQCVSRIGRHAVPPADL